MGASRDAELGTWGEEEEARVSKPPRPHKEFPVSKAAYFVIHFSTSPDRPRSALWLSLLRLRGVERRAGWAGQATRERAPSVAEGGGIGPVVPRRGWRIRSS